MPPEDEDTFPFCHACRCPRNPCSVGVAVTVRFPSIVRGRSVSTVIGEPGVAGATTAAVQCLIQIRSTAREPEREPRLCDVPFPGRDSAAWSCFARSSCRTPEGRGGSSRMVSIWGWGRVVDEVTAAGKAVRQEVPPGEAASRRRNSCASLMA